MRVGTFAFCFLVFTVVILTVTDLKAVLAQPSSKGMFSYSIAANEITLHEPVIVHFTLNNLLSEPITIDLGADHKENFRFSLTRPNGVSSDLPPLVKEGIAQIGKIVVQPGQSYKQRLLVNEWTNFPLLGGYVLTVRLASPLQTQQGRTVAKDEGFRTAFEVGARDPEKLKSVCENLLGQISSSKSYEQAAEATLTISYIRDPVSVPYLAKALLAGKLVEQIAIEGLTRIANAEAVQVLVSALTLRNKDVVILVRAALSRLETEITDPSLKEQIKRALK